MREIPEALAARLAGETTTLAHCWRLARRDGHVAGFTDHDRDIAFGGLVYAAMTGLAAAERTSEAGFAVGGGDAAGALAAAGLTEADLIAGRYDGAAVELWLVDWREPDARMLLDVATIGEITRGETAFTAELRSVAHRFDETRGEIYTSACRAAFGDHRCAINAAAPAFRGEGIVAATPAPGALRCDGLAPYVNGWFTHGQLTWTSGANAGVAADVKQHVALHGVVDVHLWTAPPHAVTVGDAFIITAGCDKAHATCRDRFANARNFRGFPHMPGNDFAIGRGLVQSDAMDGGSMFR